jgi:ribosomal protein S18 acetylase RimI-like enzyme
MTSTLQLPALDSQARPVELRPATAADAGFFARVYASGRDEELAQLPWPAEQKEAFLSSQFEAQSRHYAGAYPGAEVSVVVVGGEPAGRLFIDRAAHELHLVDVGLLPEFRGAGVGELLLRRLQDEAAKAGRRIVLYVETFNRARRLYDRLGFVDAGGDAIYRRLEWVRGSAG